MATSRTGLVGERAFKDSFAKYLQIASAARPPSPATNNMMAVDVSWHLKPPSPPCVSYSV